MCEKWAISRLVQFTRICSRMKLFSFVIKCFCPKIELVHRPRMIYLVLLTRIFVQFLQLIWFFLFRSICYSTVFYLSINNQTKSHWIFKFVRSSHFLLVFQFNRHRQRRTNRISRIKRAKTKRRNHAFAHSLMNLLTTKDIDTQRTFSSAKIIEFHMRI